MNTLPYEHPRVKMIPPVMFAIYIGAGVVLDYIYSLNYIEVSSMWLTGIAWLLILDGACLAYFSMRSFRKNDTNVATWKPATRLVDSGIFAYSRNPIYLGMMLAYIGIALLSGNAWMLLLSLPLYLQLKYNVIRREEDYLTVTFGDDYTRYRSNVNRWITFKRKQK